MKKTTKLCIILMFAVGLILGSFVLLGAAGVIHIGNNGVSVDSNSNIYIGLNSEIQVVDTTGQIIQRISPQTSKGYSFAIQDDHILIDNYVDFFILNLDGEVLHKGSSLRDTHMFEQQDTFRVENNTYHISRSDLFYKVQVEHEGKTLLVYRPPVLDLVATWVLLLLITVWAILIVATIKLIKKSDRKQTDS